MWASWWQWSLSRGFKQKAAKWSPWTTSNLNAFLFGSPTGKFKTTNFVKFSWNNEKVVRYSYSGTVFIGPEIDDPSSVYRTCLSPVCIWINYTWKLRKKLDRKSGGHLSMVEGRAWCLHYNIYHLSLLSFGQIVNIYYIRSEEGNRQMWV